MQYLGRSQNLASLRVTADSQPFSAAPANRPAGNADTTHGPGIAATISPQRLLESLRRRAGWVVLAVLLCLGAGLAFSTLSTPRYIATAKLIIDPRGLRVLDNEVQPTAQSSEAFTDLVESEMRVLKGTGVLSRVADKLQLADDEELNGSRQSLIGRLRAAIRSLLPRSEAPAADPRIRLLSTLDERIAVRRIERSFVVEISMTSADPAKSARIANALVEAYVAQSAQSQSETARRSGAALSANLDEMQKRVREAEDAVEQFKVRHGLVGSGGRLLIDQQLGELASQLSRAKNQTAEAQARVDQLTRMRQTGAVSPEAIQSTTMSALVLQVAELKRRAATLEGRLGPRHPELAELRRELSEAQANVTAEINRMAQSARVDLERSRAAERLIQTQINSQSQTATTASRAFVELRELERRAEASRSVYNASLVRSRQLQEQSLLNSTNIRPVAPAVAPDRAANPPASLILALALACGLALGGTAAVGMDAFGGRIHGREELERTSGLAVLGEVPLARASRANLAQFQSADLAAYLEVLDVLKTLGSRSVAVASAGLDGASAAVAFNLARAASTIGAKVLLIDAAVTDRTLTLEFNAEGIDGIGACARRKTRIQTASTRLFQSDITFLAADANAAVELRHVAGRGLASVIEEALTAFSLVVIDLGCIGTEPLSLTAPAAETGLLVVDKEHITRSALDAALSAASAAKLRLAGLVLAGSPSA